MAKLRTREIYSDSLCTLIAVESVDLRHVKTDSHCQLFGKIEPIAVVVRRRDGTYALDMAARPTDYDQLRQNVPELDASVTSATRS
jgi:hypothetical protein